MNQCEVIITGSNNAMFVKYNYHALILNRIPKGIKITSLKKKIGHNLYGIGFSSDLDMTPKAQVTTTKRQIGLHDS